MTPLTHQGSVEDLLARVEAATGADREIDDLLAKAFGWDFQTRSEGGRVWTEWKRPEGFRLPLGTLADPPFFTASLDAALALVERVATGWRVAHIGERRDSEDAGPYVGGWCVRLHTPANVRTNLAYGKAPTPALALLAALLRTLSGETEG